MNIIKYSTALFFFFLINQVAAQKKPTEYHFKLGFRSGYFSTIAISGQQQFNPNTHVYFSLGHRIPGGLLGSGNDTRTGVIGFGMKTLPVLATEDQGISLFGGLGAYSAVINYLQSSKDYSIDYGLTFGGGFHIHWQLVQISFHFMPGFELSKDPVEGPRRFQPLKCSGINFAIQLF